MLSELARREKEDVIFPEPEVDLFMKATAIEGIKSSLQTYYTLKKKPMMNGMRIPFTELRMIELVRELLDDETPFFFLPKAAVAEPEPGFTRESIMNKLISTVYSGPTIGDIESALSISFKTSADSDGCSRNNICRPIIQLPEKGFSKMDNKYTVRIKSCANGMTEDGYKWRKYGQKSIKNSPNPRYRRSVMVWI